MKNFGESAFLQAVFTVSLFFVPCFAFVIKNYGINQTAVSRAYEGYIVPGPGRYGDPGKLKYA